MTDRQPLDPGISRCVGTSCPSATNCRRFTERSTGNDRAAHYSRREAGASACDSYLPVHVISTFAAEAANA